MSPVAHDACATAGAQLSRCARLEEGSQRIFFGVAALFFVVSAAVTVVWCESMSGMRGMPMPGGWTMSMAWMRMPGQTWAGAAAAFVGMWVVMMVAMMLPSLVPMLWRYRHALRWSGRTRLGSLTALVGAGYFFVWTAFGVAAFPVGVALASLAMRQQALARLVPLLIGVIVLVAGALQFTAWKARHLACCRESPGRCRTLPANASAAWRHGMRLGLHCQLLLRQSDGDSFVSRSHGPARNDNRRNSHHPGTPGTCQRANCAGHRSRRPGCRTDSDRTSH